MTDKNFNNAYTHSFDAIIERLMVLFSVDELQKVAQKIGLSKQALYARKKTNSIPYDNIIQSVKDSDVNIEWLIYGLGEQKLVPKFKLGNEKSAPFGEIAVRMFPDVSASAGYGCLNGDQCEYETIYVDRNLLEKTSSKSIDAIKVHGDSMFPTMREGDMIFVDKLQHEIKNGKIFIIRMNEEVFVKRLYTYPKGIIVKSDNPEYPQFEVQKKDIEIFEREQGR